MKTGGGVFLPARFRCKKCEIGEEGSLRGRLIRDQWEDYGTCLIHDTQFVGVVPNLSHPREEMERWWKVQKGKGK